MSAQWPSFSLLDQSSEDYIYISMFPLVFCRSHFNKLIIKFRLILVGPTVRFPEMGKHRPTWMYYYSSILAARAALWPCQVPYVQIHSEDTASWSCA